MCAILSPALPGEEVFRVVVVWGSGEQFDIERTFGAILQAQLLNQIGGLEHAAQTIAIQAIPAGTGSFNTGKKVERYNKSAQQVSGERTNGDSMMHRVKLHTQPPAQNAAGAAAKKHSQKELQHGHSLFIDRD